MTVGIDDEHHASLLPLPKQGRGNRIAAQSVQAHVLHDTPGPSPGPRPYYVEITAGVAPDAMTRAEAGVTPLRQAFAFQGQNTDQAAVMLRNIDDVVSIHVEKGRANQRCGPDPQKFAVLVKDLDTVVLAVRHQHAPVLINPDTMR